MRFSNISKASSSNSRDSCSNMLNKILENKVPGACLISPGFKSLIIQTMILETP
jgi:hypothetical protein